MADRGPLPFSRLPFDSLRVRRLGTIWLIAILGCTRPEAPPYAFAPSKTPAEMAQTRSNAWEGIEQVQFQLEMTARPSRNNPSFPPDFHFLGSYEPILDLVRQDFSGIVPHQKSVRIQPSGYILDEARAQLLHRYVRWATIPFLQAPPMERTRNVDISYQTVSGRDFPSRLTIEIVEGSEDHGWDLEFQYSNYRLVHKDTPRAGQAASVDTALLETAERRVYRLANHCRALRCLVAIAAENPEPDLPVPPNVRLEAAYRLTLKATPDGPSGIRLSLEQLSLSAPSSVKVPSIVSDRLGEALQRLLEKIFSPVPGLSDAYRRTREARGAPEGTSFVVTDAAEGQPREIVFLVDTSGRLRSVRTRTSHNEEHRRFQWNELAHTGYLLLGKLQEEFSPGESPEGTPGELSGAGPTRSYSCRTVVRHEMVDGLWVPAHADQECHEAENPHGPHLTAEFRDYEVQR